MNAYGVQDDDGFMERVVGVYIGEWEDEKLYAILYTETGKKFLCRYAQKGDWQIVAWQDEHGEEEQLEEPSEAPNPLVVAWTFATQAVDDDLDDIVI